MRNKILITSFVLTLLILLGSALAQSCTYAWDCPEKTGYSRICSNYVNGVGECSYYDDDAGCFAAGYWVDSCDECCYYCCDNHKCVIGASECEECGNVGGSCTYDYDCCGSLICRGDRTCAEPVGECTSDSDCKYNGRPYCLHTSAVAQQHCSIPEGECWTRTLEICPEGSYCVGYGGSSPSNQDAYCEELPCLPDGTFSPTEIDPLECCSDKVWIGETFGVKHWFCGIKECPSSVLMDTGETFNVGSECNEDGKDICKLDNHRWVCQAIDITNDDEKDILCWIDYGIEDYCKEQSDLEKILAEYPWLIIIIPGIVGYYLGKGKQQKKKALVIGLACGGVLYYLFSLSWWQQTILGLGLGVGAIAFLTLGGGALIMYFLTRRD